MRPEETPVWTRRLQCEECGRVSRGGERGWKAYLDDEDNVVVLCE